MSSNAPSTPMLPFTPLHSSDSPGATHSAGYARGYAQGWAVGNRAAAARAEAGRAEAAEREARVRAQTEANLATVLRRLDDAAQAARQRAVPVLAEAQTELATAAVALAEALLGAELSDRSTAVRTAVRRAMDGSGTERVLRIRLNPQDLQVLDGAEVPGGVEVVADPALSSGDSIAEFEDGILDARLGPALARVRQVLEPAR